MFIKLLPDQVMRYWDEVSSCIDAALPPHVEPNFINIQELLLVGEMECWVSIRGNVISAVMVTQWINDSATGTLQLLIFTLVAVDETHFDTYQEAHDVLIKYAKSRGCKRIIAYSPHQRVIELAKAFGADCSWHLLSLEVK